MRPEVGPAVARYSQRRVDAIDLEANILCTLPFREALRGLDDPRLDLYLSLVSEGTVYESPTALLPGDLEVTVLTCNKFLRETSFVPVMAAMLGTLERAYGHPIDIEFTANLDADDHLRINLVQCRPMSLPGWRNEAIPTALAPEVVLFRSRRMAGGGVVRGIRYVIYIDPAKYAALGTGDARGRELRGRLGRVVGRLNAHPRLAAGPWMMVGPGAGAAAISPWA